jgi:hypothetical protein
VIIVDKIGGKQSGRMPVSFSEAALRIHPILIPNGHALSRRRRIGRWKRLDRDAVEEDLRLDGILAESCLGPLFLRERAE